MSNRLGFRAYLLNGTSIPHLYYQPPESKKLEYPCIIYSLANANTRSANNRQYKISPSYTVILVDKNPDSEYVQRLLELPKCRFDRSYVADNLNHWIFTIHYTGTFPDVNS